MPTSSKLSLWFKDKSSVPANKSLTSKSTPPNASALPLAYTISNNKPLNPKLMTNKPDRSLYIEFTSKFSRSMFNYNSKESDHLIKFLKNCALHSANSNKMLLHDERMHDLAVLERVQAETQIWLVARKGKSERYDTVNNFLQYVERLKQNLIDEKFRDDNNYFNAKHKPINNLPKRTPTFHRPIHNDESLYYNFKLICNLSENDERNKSLFEKLEQATLNFTNFSKKQQSIDSPKETVTFFSKSKKNQLSTTERSQDNLTLMSVKKEINIWLKENEFKRPYSREHDENVASVKHFLNELNKLSEQISPQPGKSACPLHHLQGYKRPLSLR